MAEMNDVELTRRLHQLMDGYLTTQLLHAASESGALAALASGAQSAGQLAPAIGVDEPTLHRILRGLAIEDVVVEQPGGAFELTGLGSALANAAGPLRVRAGLYYRAAGGLLDALRTSGTAFETVYGRPFFAQLETDSDAASAFEASMAGRSVAEARDVVAAYDFTAHRTVVDVGGGRGVMLSTVLAAAPHATGILLDRPMVTDQARAHLDEAGLATRVRVVAGDFFDTVPAGGDVYLLVRVLHDWDDAAARAILQRCRQAMTTGAVLVVVDALLPDRAVDSPGAIRMDLHMMVLFGSAERSADQLTALLDTTGFEVRRLVPTRSPVGLAVVEAVAVEGGRGPAKK